MKIPFLTSLFQKPEKTLEIPNSLLIQKLTSLLDNDYLLYQNVTIYHHAQSLFIPLLLVNPSRGIYIFEYKTWSYDELKVSTIEKASAQSSSNENLAYEQAHEIIKQRFQELTHTDGVNIHNYLIMENLSSEQYQNLNVSFQELLPSQKIIFNDSSDTEILKKLESAPETLNNHQTVQSILGTILIQYTIIQNNQELSLCNKEQINFINSDISGHTTLAAMFGSGATNIILLKVILEKLKNPKVTINIIKPTLLACDILKKKLLEIVEHAIIEIDLSSIQILTPTQVLNKHLQKLSKPLLTQEEFHIDNILMKKKMNHADIIVCDDADLLESEFIAYLKHIQKNETLLLVGDFISENIFTLQHSFRRTKQKSVFLKTNPYAKAMQLVSKLLETNEAKDIIIISNSLNKEKLNEDLKSFIKDKAVLLDSSKNLLDQDIDNLLLASYEDIVGLSAEHIILIDVCKAPKEQLSYAFNLCEKEVYVLYEEDCPEIDFLRKRDENS